jgi:hypothetical protein
MKAPVDRYGIGRPPRIVIAALEQEGPEPQGSIC